MMLMSKNNKGFSLVEIVVVIAITAIITTGSIIGIGMLRGWKASKCIELTASALREVKTEQMGRDSLRLEIRKDGDYYTATKISYSYKVDGGVLQKDILDTGDTDVPVKLGEVGAISVELTFRKKNDFNTSTPSSEQTVNLDDVSKVTIGFERSTGSFLPAEVDGASAFPTDYYLYKVTVTQGTVSKTLKCEQLTGQIYTE